MNWVSPEKEGAATVVVSEVPELELEPPELVPSPVSTVTEPLVMVPSALMVVCSPYSFTMMMTVLSPAMALRVMVAGHSPSR